jgi:transcriptional regulator with XRE-family HTH domain
MKVGVRMAELRKKKELSQTDFSKTVGVARYMIGRYERDEVFPSIEVAKNIPDALKVSLDYMVWDGMNTKLISRDRKALRGYPTTSQSGENIVYRMIDMALVYSKTKKA